jgi:hypothetical protein
MRAKALGLFLTISFLSHVSMAALKSTRWTLNDDRDASLSHVLAKANANLGTDLHESDLQLEEEQNLGAWKFQMWSQVIAGLKVKGASLRIWKNLSNGELVQAEVQFENPNATHVRNLLMRNGGFSRRAVSSREITALASSVNLTRFRNSKTTQMWHPEFGPVHKIEIFGNTYKWEILQSLKTGRTLSKVRKDYPQSDLTRRADEFDLPASVFVAPEEVGESTREPSPYPKQNVTLKYLKRTAVLPTQNMFAAYADQVFADSKHDEAKGQTAEGRADGYWSSAWLKQMIANTMAGVPSVDNTLDSGRVNLVGRYVSVQVHPDAMTQYRPSYPLVYGAGVHYNWQELPPTNGQPDWGMTLSPTFMGKPGSDFWDFYNRPSPWRLEANTTDLMNEGFDDVQVYWTVNQWFESLHDLGFHDPDISTRPITAILYNPDIEGRDNAFYTDDTINFSTYSQSTANYARDTGTIWHELGHGLEDRILKNADYAGGLSEGVADLTADMMFNEMFKTAHFPGKDERRIVNQVAFNLTNEEHDEGEAYGGALRDLSEKIIQDQGYPGFRKFADLLFDSMRLSRNNPGLDLQEWFRHMLFADELGKPGLREKGEFATKLGEVLKARNFSFDPADSASLPIMVVGYEALTNSSPGSRYNKIEFDLQQNETKTFHLKIKIQDGNLTKFKYPVRLRISYRGGPLQGSSKFLNEETPQEWTLTQSGQEIDAPITVLAGCDSINRNDNRCSDFAYIQVINSGDTLPIGKKRFYVNVNALAR